MVEPALQQLDPLRLDEVLGSQPGLSIVPSNNGRVVLAGTFRFSARTDGCDEIADTYDIELRVPSDFPREPATVRATGDRIPRDYHTNPDGTLCLGSRVRLQLALHEGPTLPEFMNRCLLPFLYGRSYYERHGTMPFGELAHGDEGLLQDYMSLFGVKDEQAAVNMLELMGMKKRIANKKPCPCGSGKRVGRCHHMTLNPLRKRLGRRWCRIEYWRWLRKIGAKSV